MKLKVRLFRVKDTGVLGWIEEQKGIKRGKFELEDDNGFVINSQYAPEIDEEGNLAQAHLRSDSEG